MRMQTDKDCPPPTLDEPPPYSIGVMAGMALIMVLLLACGVWSVAQSAVTTINQTSYALRPCSTCREVVYPTEAECKTAADAEADRVGQTRTTGSAVYTCIIRYNLIATFKPNPAVNRSPTITGSAQTTGTVGQLYTFTPTAADPDGDPLTFEVIARPPWTGWTFDTATGRMSGTPNTVRTHPGISITVSDGRGGSAELRLPTITITAGAPTPVNCVVSAYGAWTGGAWSACASGSQTRQETRTRTVTTPASGGGTACPVLTETRTASQACTVTRGTALLSWNHDGANVTGFRVVYGTSPSTLAQTVQVDNPAARTANVTGLARGTYHFAVKAFNASGESEASNVISKVIL